MLLQTLITATDLVENLENPNWVVIDSCYSLVDTEPGWRQDIHSHIAGAIYLHLDKHLSAQVIPGITRRYPFPSVEDATRTFSN